MFPILDSNFFLVNKPMGWTSHDVVAFIRKKIKSRFTDNNPDLRIRITNGLPKRHSLYSREFVDSHLLKVGHAGTLDPFATGLLIIGIGRESTKRLDEFKKLPKTYVATLKLGAVSDTYDRTGKIRVTHNSQLASQPLNQITSYELQVTSYEKVIPTIADVQTIINSFLGKQLQTPPMHSAKKVGGQRLYKLARKGIEIERKPNEIEIFDIKILEYQWPFLKIEVTCSAGTYIRSLAHDIGQKLGVGAYCEELVRTAIGNYRLKEAAEIRDLM